MQGGEDIPPCTQRSLVYENICLRCNPTAREKGELREQNGQSVYVGETARSIQERAKEHWESFKSKDPKSHILKHHLIHHGAEGEPKFIMKVVKFYRTALSRQVAEAVRIKRRGEVLNSRTEYNRCSIQRLTLEQNIPQDTGGEQDQGYGGAGDEWTEQWLEKRDAADKENRASLGRVQLKVMPKRKEQATTENVKRTKRRKYVVLGEEWGLEGSRETTVFKTYFKTTTKPIVLGKNISTLAIEWDVNRLKIKAIEYSGSQVGVGVGGLTESHTPSVSTEIGVCGGDMGVTRNESKVKTSSKKKVWTRMKNGLYQWRVIKTGGRRSNCETTMKSGSGRGPQLAGAPLVYVLATTTGGLEKIMNKCQAENNKRKSNFGGNIVLDGAITDLGGEVSDPEEKAIRLDNEDLRI